MLGLGWAELILRESPPFVRARDNVIELRVQTPDTTCVRAPLAGVYFISSSTNTMPRTASNVGQLGSWSTQ